MTDWVVDLANHVRSNFPDWAQNVFAYQLPEGAPDPSIVIAPVIEGIPYDVEYPDRYRGPYRAIVTTKDIALAHNLGEEVLRMLTIFGTQMGGTEIIRSFPTNTPVVYPKAASDLYEVMVMLEVILIDRRIRTGADLVGTGLLTMGSFSLNGQSVTSISGNVNITMGNFTLTAEDLASTGSGDSTLDDFTLNGVSKLAITAALNEGMDSFSMSATGAHGSFPGSLISSLNSFSMNAAGTTLIEMSGGYTLDDFTISGGGLPGITAVAAVSLDDFTADGIASTFFPANGLVIMDDFSASGSGVITISGSAGVTLGDFTLTTATNLPISGALNQNFPALTLAGVSPMTIEGDLVSVMGDFTLSAVGINTKVGDLSSTLDDFTLTGTANTAISGFVVFDFDPFTLSGSINSEASGSMVATMGDFTLASIGTTAVNATATSSLDEVTVTGVADPSLIDASASINIGEFSMSGSGNSDVSGVANASVADFNVNGSSFTEIGASGNMTVQDFTVVASTSNSSIASAAAIPMGDFAVFALSNLAIPGSTISALGEFAVTASAESSIPANATMVMDVLTIVSSGESEITGSATTTLDAFTLSASGTLTVVSGPNETETDALIAQMSAAPDATREGHINTLVKSMKDAGVWTKLAWFSIIGHDQDASLKNWIVPTEDLQMLNNPVVVADTYFDSQSTTAGNGCFRAGKANDGGAALADVTLGCYFVKLDESGQTRASRITDNQTFFRCDFSAPLLKMTGGSSFVNNYATYVITADYHITGVHRGTGASDREGYYNGVSYDTKSGAGGSLGPTSDVDLFGTANKNSDERYICGYYGTALTSQEVSDLHDAIEVYKTAIGA